MKKLTITGITFTVLGIAALALASSQTSTSSVILRFGGPNSGTETVSIDSSISSVGGQNRLGEVPVVIGLSTHTVNGFATFYIVSAQPGELHTSDGVIYTLSEDAKLRLGLERFSATVISNPDQTTDIAFNLVDRKTTVDETLNYGQTCTTITVGSDSATDCYGMAEGGNGWKKL